MLLNGVPVQTLLHSLLGMLVYGFYNLLSQEMKYKLLTEVGDIFENVEETFPDGDMPVFCVSVMPVIIQGHNRWYILPSNCTRSIVSWKKNKINDIMGTK